MYVVSMRRFPLYPPLCKGYTDQWNRSRPRGDSHHQHFADVHISPHPHDPSLVTTSLTTIVVIFAPLTAHRYRSLSR